MSIAPVLRQIILDFPTQFVEGIRAAQLALRETSLPKISRRTSHIVFCGMGGSALSGLLVSDWIRYDLRLQRKHIHPFVHRDYALPLEVMRGSAIVLVTSYSGNTEEAFSAYHEARKHRLPLFTIASGGALAERAQRDRVPLAMLPKGIPPRFAIASQLGATLVFLTAASILPKWVLNDAVRSLRILRPEKRRSKGEALAGHIGKRIPIFYSSSHNAALAYILKIQMNENVKIPAFTHVFPELNHNEMNTYASLSKTQAVLHKPFIAVFLEDATDPLRIRKRIALMKALLRKNGVAIYSLSMFGRTPFLKSVNAILLGEWGSVALASFHHVDPLPTDFIEEFKKKL